MTVSPCDWTFVPEKLQGLTDDLVDRQQCLFGRLPRRHRSNTRYHVGRSSRVGDNGLGQFADVGLMRAVCAKSACTR